VKLRGQISQGIVASPSLVPDDVIARGPEAMTAHLGVTKYEPEEIVCADATLVELPDGVSVYDIEGADRYTDAAAMLLDGDVVITEKVEGSNFSVMVRADGAVLVNQRTKTIVPREGVEHTFWKAARQQRLAEFAQSIAARHPGRQVVVYGEIVGPGIQGNLYKLKGHAVRLFDVRVGLEWMSAAPFFEAVETFYGSADEMTVPVLHRGSLAAWLAGKSVKEASNGRSRLADVAREGIVIRPAVERNVQDLGRLILKQRSPEYLARSEY
jgi:RNA ligase (TIGR02306 family)